MPPRRTTRKRKPAPRKRAPTSSATDAERERHPQWFKPGQSGNPARRFKPGQSGNPVGTSKKLRLREALKSKLEEIVTEDPKQRSYAEILMERLVAAGAKDWRANLAVYEIFEGKPKQTVEAEVTEGVSFKDVVAKLPLEAQRLVMEATKKATEEKGEED